MRYSTNGFTRFDPFFYVSYDDEFFYKSHNAVAVESSVQRGPILARYSPLALLVKDVWAHHPPPNYPPHGALPSCYHEDKSGYLSRFMFTDDHEGTSSPEMEIRVNASFRVMSSAWNNHKVPRGFWDYRKADHKNTWYPPYDGLYPEMWRHPGYNCVGDVFDASDSNYGKEDWVHVKVVERDLSHWINPDDTVGEWRFVPTYDDNPTRLTPTHSKRYGNVHDAYVYLTFHDSEVPLRNE